MTLWQAPYGTLSGIEERGKEGEAIVSQEGQGKVIVQLLDLSGWDKSKRGMRAGDGGEQPFPDCKWEDGGAPKKKKEKKKDDQDNIDSRHTDHLAQYTAPGLVRLHSDAYSSQSATRTFHNCSQKRSQKNSLSHSVLNTAPTIDKELIKRNHRRNIHIIVHYPASDGSSGHCQTPRSIHDVH